MDAQELVRRYKAGERDFSKVELLGGDLRGANLRGANLCEADLSFVYLEWADLRGANLYRANLSGTLVTSEQLIEAWS